jgi:hypothetical protein
VAAYADGFATAARRIRSTYGGAVEVVHGFPILQAGLADRAVIRALLDIDLWFGKMAVPKGRTFSKQGNWCMIPGLETCR